MDSISNESFPLREMRFVASQNHGKARCEPGWNWHPVALRDYDLWYVVSGQGKMRLGGSLYPVRKGACFLVHPGDQPQAEQDPDNRLTVIFIHFTIEPADGSRSCVRPYSPALLPERVIYLEDTNEFEMLLHRTLECLYGLRLWADEEFDCLMKQVAIALYRFRQRPDEHASLSKKQTQAVLRIIQRIRESSGRRLPHEELAALVGLTPAYLSKIFKTHTGISLKEYFTKVRLERAMHLLTETTMNVSQVSDALGYSSVFLFSKQFKQHYGAPPSTYALSSIQAKPFR